MQSRNVSRAAVHNTGDPVRQNALSRGSAIRPDSNQKGVEAHAIFTAAWQRPA